MKLKTLPLPPMKQTRSIFRYIFLCLLLAGLCDCSGGRKNDDSICVSVLRGPSAVAFAGWMEHPPLLGGKRLDVNVYDSPEQVQAAMIKGEADIAVLPMVNAANLYTKKIPYVLAGCPLWGTLYIIGKVPVDKLNVFGMGTTPDILTRDFMERTQWNCTLDYSLTTPSEVTQAMLMGKVQAAVLSEPFVGMVLQRDTLIHILADLNHPDGSDGQGFAQTAVMIRSSLSNERKMIDSLLTATCLFARERPEEVICTLKNRKLFAAGMLTPAGLERLRIQYVPAAGAEAEIRSFLELIYRYEPKAIGGQMPDRGFITAAP